MTWGWDDLFGENTSFTLDDALDITGGNYEQDFREYWGLEASTAPDWMEHDDWLAVKKAFGMGVQSAALALALVAPKGVGPGHLESLKEVRRKAEEFSETLRDIKLSAIESGNENLLSAIKRIEDPVAPGDSRTRLGIYENAVQMSLCGALIPSLRTAAQRVERLLSCVQKVTNPRVSAYLSRVARCYCLDLRTEMAVMSRATVDAMLEDLIPNEAVEQAVGLGTRAQIGLASRINAAIALKTGDSRTIAAIQKIKTNGDEAAHNTPGLEPTCDDQLNLLTQALEGFLKS